MSGIVRAMAIYPSEAEIVATASRRSNPRWDRPRPGRIQMRRRITVAATCPANRFSVIGRFARALMPNPTRMKTLDARHATRP
jgi:hypothetical protein